MTLVTGAAITMLAYLLGALPSGLIMGRLVGGVDVRQHGSGKTGATNVVRTVGWGPGLVVLLADLLKGVAAVLVGRLIVGSVVELYPLADAISGVAALVGHNWPVYVGFRGGRGVATGIGTLAAVTPGIALIVVLVGIAVILITDIVSLGSVAATSTAMVLIVASVAFGAMPEGYVLYAVVASLLIIVRHNDNLQRAIAGRERRMGIRSKLSAKLGRRADPERSPARPPGTEQ